jgi:Ca2+-binding EF-hand superfamily protein
MDAYAQFLKFDGEILHFYALWDDTDNIYGEKRKFSLKYFLADDTVEVNEIYKPNCGYDPYPKFFRRGRLHRTSRLPQPGEKPDFIRDSELRIGTKVPIAGRHFFIYDCSERTRQYYQAKYGIAMDPIDSGEAPPPEPVDPPLPPHTGFGSEEDSLGSVYSLMPKPPRKDLVKLMEKEGKTLRFSARMDTRKPDDIARRFIITYYLMDDSVQIFEPQQRNSGIVSGKFLERRRVNRPDGIPFAASDFFVGAVVEMLAQRFVLLDADDSTLDYMERNDGFPMSNIAVVRQRILEEIARSGGDPAAIFKRFDTDRSGSLSIPEFRQAVRSLQIDLTEQELLTVMRHYDYDKDGKVQYGEFLRALDGDDDADSNAAAARRAAAERSVRPTPQETLALAKIMDVLRDKAQNRKPQLRDTFREFDTNKDSLLDVEEFKAGLDKIGLTLTPRMLEFLLEKFYYDEEENLWKPSIDYTGFVEALWEGSLNKM